MEKGLQIENLTLSIGGRLILDGISMALESGTFAALCGHNGAGKSQLLRCIKGLRKQDGGRILINGTEADEKERLKKVALVFQNAEMQIVSQSVEKDIAFGPENMGLDRAEIRRRVESAMSLMGLTDKAKQRPQTLSGGELRKCAIAGILAMEPDVILLDEPVLGFDAIMRVEFYDMLAESFCRKPRIIIVSTHIIEEIAETVHRLIIIDKCRICFYDTMKAVGEKSFAVSGFRDDVEDAVRTLNVISREISGGLETAYIYDTPPAQAAALKVCPMSLQDLFIRMVGHKGGRK